MTLERRMAQLKDQAAAQPKIDREVLLRLAHDLPTAWNAAGTDARTKQRLIRLLVEEVVIDLDDAANEAVLLVHWVGGRHTKVRVARVKTGAIPPIEIRVRSRPSASSVANGRIAISRSP